MNKTFEELLETFEPQSKTEMIIGFDSKGNIKSHDLLSDSHILLGGAIGSGKQIAIQQMITSIMAKRSDEEVKFTFYDPKKTDYKVYNHSKNNYRDNIVDIEELKMYLKHLQNLKEERINKMRRVNCKDINEYNNYAKSKNTSLMTHIVNVFDELNNTVIEDKEISDILDKLMVNSQSLGIYFIVSTQTLKYNKIHEKLKKYMPCRIAMKLNTQSESQSLIDEAGAEKLPNHGAMLYKDKNGNMFKLQASYITEERINKIING
ncbi:FtsK/SpoIIIE domain-containing protein [Staphylococcus argenteus]|uniref:FtsK/SpoIIIE domain-containing protein n=1 Tax=Staphylococcus TaxID=1279 RepID=UPI000E330F8B|nr:FtsK/SpoIIIE domain-containing protein [Staphylococcus argenteus]BBD87506.1 hypothetical protein SA58113_p20062 [Staphylococcus argenteus]